MSQRFDKAKADYTESFNRHSVLVKTLEMGKEDMEKRQKKYKALRNERTEKVKHYFKKNLERRGMQGNLMFTHPSSKRDEKGRLDMEVSIDAQSDETCKDVRQLSGGERSFTTFCLLLALGTIIEGPFRIMDEYDVFLDEVARKITLNQLELYCKGPAQRGKQFIIITPNKLDDVCTGPKVRINKMPDPVRASAVGPQQQVLAYKST